MCQCKHVHAFVCPAVRLSVCACVYARRVCCALYVYVGGGGGTWGVMYPSVNVNVCDAGEEGSKRETERHCTKYCSHNRLCTCLSSIYSAWRAIIQGSAGIVTAMALKKTERVKNNSEQTDTET